MKFRENVKRAKLATVMLYVMVGLQSLALISAILQWILLRDFSNGVQVTLQDISSNDIRERVIGLITAVAYIITIVVFIQWFRRAYFNLHLRCNNLEYTEGWAAGAWFIPIFNLFAPYKIFRDLFTKSKETLERKGVTEKLDLPMNLVNGYWLIWVVGNIVTNVSFRKAMTQNLDDLMFATTTDIIGTFLSIIAAVLLTIIIKKYNQIEPLLEDMKSEIDTIGERE